MMKFDTKNQSFRQVMGSGLKYNEPRFQREYSWEEDQWYDLWQDICQLNTNSVHYMGYLVLQSSDNKNFTIIDGQQRLTTISIIILAALYKLNQFIKNGQNPEENKKRKETLINSFIGFTDPVSLLPEYKLTLNRNNDSFFKTFLCKLKKPPVRRVKRTEKLMALACEYFEKNLFSRCTDGKSIAELIERMVDRLVFTTITVDGESNAYTVFETLNARGVQLSTPDLVKNYIFSLIDQKGQLHDEKIEELETQWNQIIHQLEKHKFSHFIRVDWNSKNEFTRTNELFKKIKAKLDNKEKAHEYLESLQSNSEIYSALQDYNDEFWKRYEDGKYNNSQIKFSLKTLNLFNIVTPQSLLISAFNKFNPSDFMKFLHYIEVISIRYNIICGKHNWDQEQIYCKTALKIAQSSMKNLSIKDVLDVLKEIYPKDEEFIHAFSTKKLKTKQTNKKARYLLYRIEKHLNKNDKNFIDFDSVSLEHILPLNPTEQWIKSLNHPEQAEDWIERIGNLTLISKEDNKKIGRTAFEDKKNCFKNNPIAITKKCAEYLEWNEDSISKHQEWLGKISAELWRLPN